MDDDDKVPLDVGRRENLSTGPHRRLRLPGRGRQALRPGHGRPAPGQRRLLPVARDRRGRAALVRHGPDAARPRRHARRRPLRPGPHRQVPGQRRRQDQEILGPEALTATEEKESPMEIIIQPDSQQASQIAARIVARTVREKPHAVLGLATGNTPLQLYREPRPHAPGVGARLRRRDQLQPRRVRRRPAGPPLARSTATCGPTCSATSTCPRSGSTSRTALTSDIPAACRKYEQAIRSAGGIDIQVLGIGTNGHIGFNEPSSSLSSRTRIKTLTEETRLDAAAAFGGEEGVPTHVLTMGLGTIMDSPDVPAPGLRQEEGPGRRPDGRGPGHGHGARLGPPDAPAGRPGRRQGRRLRAGDGRLLRLGPGAQTGLAEVLSLI
ncbi:MAG: hypothetical protein MZW92_03240 [Comamonadaceae bacterium]|nr:hypothetical protein [Comamonadaceae bacterium]